MSDSHDIDSAATYDDFEVVDVETREDTATIQIKESVRERERHTPNDMQLTVEHSHTWTCEKTRDGVINTPVAAPDKIETVVERLDIDFGHDDEERPDRVLEVSDPEAREAAENGETYDVDGITLYASQLFTRDDELRQIIRMCDGRIVRIEEVQPATGEQESIEEQAVMADGGEETDDDKIPEWFESLMFRGSIEINEHHSRHDVADSLRDDFTRL